MHLMLIDRLIEQRLENNPCVAQTHLIQPQSQHTITQPLSKMLMVAFRRKSLNRRPWKRDEEGGI